MNFSFMVWFVCRNRGIVLTANPIMTDTKAISMAYVASAPDIASPVLF